ncbi:MAG: hypothetical protein KAY24_08605 [Candidatus Eisenbacteria sp.]|nr:hypothetical protein [Candidatus Eisenbacteria bacterium]
MAALVQDSGKPTLLLINKWDAVEKDTHTFAQKEEEVREELTFLDYAPTLFVSALTGQRTSQIPEKILSLYAEAQRKIPTHEVNQTLRRAIERTPPRGKRGKRPPKILYATQIRCTPPTFALFSKHGDLLSQEYLRYLGRRFREAFGFEGSPIRFKIRKNKGTPARGRPR